MVSPVGTFFIVLAVVLIVAAVGWIVFTQLRARRLGLPAPPLSSYIPFVHSEPSSSYGPPQPAPGGIRGWVNDKWRAFRNSGNRSASGAYERPSRRGFGPLDPDEAWDSRVGHEADGYYGYGYEEQELGLRGQGQRSQQQHESNTGYSNVNLGADERRGRTLSRDQGPSVGGNGNANLGSSRNPFDDDSAEPSNISMRGVSPRPIDTNVAATKAMAGGKHDSPTSERRSIFREEV